MLSLLFSFFVFSQCSMYRSSVAWRSVSLCWKLHHITSSPFFFPLACLQAWAMLEHVVQECEEVFLDGTALCRWRIRCNLLEENYLPKWRLHTKIIWLQKENSEMMTSFTHHNLKRVLFWFKFDIDILGLSIYDIFWKLFLIFFKRFKAVQSILC